MQGREFAHELEGVSVAGQPVEQSLAGDDRSPAWRRGSVAKGSHGDEGTPGNTRRSEPSVNPAGFTYMSKEE